MSEPNPSAASAPAATTSILQVVPGGVKSLLPFDILRVGAHTLRGWKWTLLAGVLGGAGALSLGWFKFTDSYTVQVQLVRQESKNNFQASREGESFQPRQFNAATVSSMMRSNSLMEKTAATQKPPLPTEEVQKNLVIKPEKNTDLITVSWTEAISREHAVQLINRYAEDVVELTKVLQADEAREMLGSITAQVERTETELAAVQRELMAYSKESKLFDAEKETDSYLKQIGDLELKIETSRIEREAVDYRLTQTGQELAKQNPGLQRLKEAKDKLGELLTQLTNKHPAVVEQQARVAALEKSITAAGAATGGDVTSGFQASGNNMINNLYMDILTQRALKESLWNQISSLQTYRDQLKARLETIPDKNLVQVRIKSRATALEETRRLLAGRQREAQLFAENAPEYYRLFAPATVENVEVSSRIIKILLGTAVGAVFAAGLVAALRALKAAMDDRIISPSDVRRLTRVQVIAALPPEEDMDPASLGRWQFSTWASLVKAIPAPPDGALILGLLSAEDGAGKSTWLRHLGRAALDRGLKVLAITNGESTGPAASSVPLTHGLNSPEKILTHLRNAESPALELNAPDTWAWTAATRFRWRNALTVWSQEPRLVVLVELPAASKLDSLLLAETLPAILWLSDSGKHRREEVAGIIDTIRESGVPLAGSLLNRIPPLFAKLPDLAKFGLCLAASLAFATSPVSAQKAPAPPSAIQGDLPSISLTAAPEDAPTAPVLTDPPSRLPPEPGALQPTPVPEAAPVFLATPPEKKIPIPVLHPELAPWQQRLTLGPGDQVNLQVYGHKEFARSSVPVGPDGTLSYLQVAGFPAEGKTIDELREGLTGELRKYIQNAQVIVSPGAFRSKKYFIMGTIMDRGAYTLDRPVTLLEAAARSRGIATGLLAQNTVEIADMRRAFIVRDGKKLDVDFNKLFYEGDTSRNIPLFPGDYIYFPSNTVNEVYILGAVASPGQAGVTESLTALGAITIRGGFSAAAWRKKVLIVRGTMNKAKPEVIEVNAAAILAGKQKDVLLEPRDLVYVSERPWQKAADLFDSAVRSFVQTSTGTWIGQNIGPFLKEPILPSLKNP